MAVMPTQLLVDTPTQTSVSTPVARSTVSILVEQKAPIVVLLSTGSLGSGVKSATISCSFWPLILFVAVTIGFKCCGTSCASGVSAP